MNLAMWRGLNIAPASNIASALFHKS